MKRNQRGNFYICELNSIPPVLQKRLGRFFTDEEKEVNEYFSLSQKKKSPTVKAVDSLLHFFGHSTSATVLGKKNKKEDKLKLLSDILTENSLSETKYFSGECILFLTVSNFLGGKLIKYITSDFYGKKLRSNFFPLPYSYSHSENIINTSEFISFLEELKSEIQKSFFVVTINNFNVLCFFGNYISPSFSRIESDSFSQMESDSFSRIESDSFSQMESDSLLSESEDEGEILLPTNCESSATPQKEVKREILLFKNIEKLLSRKRLLSFHSYAGREGDTLYSYSPQKFVADASFTFFEDPLYLVKIEKTKRGNDKKFTKEETLNLLKMDQIKVSCDKLFFVYFLVLFSPRNGGGLSFFKETINRKVFTHEIENILFVCDTLREAHKLKYGDDFPLNFLILKEVIYQNSLRLFRK